MNDKALESSTGLPAAGSHRVDKTDKRIAYFSMEIGLTSRMPTYSGGLGVLAGDTVKSCADLSVPLVAVSLLYKKGYFFQTIDGSGEQREEPHNWSPEEFLKPLDKVVTVEVEGKTVVVRAWRYNVIGVDGYCVPAIFLDTDVKENDSFGRDITHHLYGGDEGYRLSQEIVLGIGGVRMLEALGFNNLRRYHMNEGHSSLLTLELLKRRKSGGNGWDVEAVRKMCVFTTHTPVPAGHDQFSYDLVDRVLGDHFPPDLLRKLGGEDKLNMTLLALNLSHHVNGVAKVHGRVSREMFPGYQIDHITNGIHSATWVGENMQKIFDEFIPGWRKDPFSLRYALSIPGERIGQAHFEAKKELIDITNKQANAGMEYHPLTIGFARRATAYKRADLILSDMERLEAISDKVGRIQIIFAGKAHPGDWHGKELIKKIVSESGEHRGNLRIAYLENYDIELARSMISGVDLWLNTPRKPKEASGTSGMKAAHNGVPSLSILDGWWIEGCLEGLTGWSIGSAEAAECDDAEDARSLYEKLEGEIVPLFYNQRGRWLDVMRRSIAINASFFNTHRMVQQYVVHAYL
jgi:starch phosphorylase